MTEYLLLAAAGGFFLGVLTVIILGSVFSTQPEDVLGRRRDHARRLKINEIFRKYRAGEIDILQAKESMRKLGVSMHDFRHSSSGRSRNFRSEYRSATGSPDFGSSV